MLDSKSIRQAHAEAVNRGQTGYLYKPTGGRVYAHSADKYVPRELCISCDENFEDVLTMENGWSVGLCKGCVQRRKDPLAAIQNAIREVLFSQHAAMPYRQGWPRFLTYGDVILAR